MVEAHATKLPKHNVKIIVIFFGKLNLLLLRVPCFSLNMRYLMHWLRLRLRILDRGLMNRNLMLLSNWLRLLKPKHLRLTKKLTHQSEERV